MRFILWLGLALGVLWGGYWVVGAYVIENRLHDWFQAQKAGNLVATQSDIGVAGFADRFDVTVTSPSLRDPVSGWGWKAPFAQVFAMTWKPWHLIAALPPTQTVQMPDGQSVTIGSAKLQASLLMQPASDLPPRRAILDGSGLSLASDAGWTAKADRVVLAAETTGDTMLHLGADATNLSPPVAFAGLPDLGPVLSMLHLDGTLGFSAPVTWDMAQATPRELSLTSLRLHWGALDLTARGKVTTDAAGLPEGRIDMDLRGWRSLPAVVVALGLVKPEVEGTVTRALEFLAASSPDPEVLSLPLIFRQGVMSLGPLPLGPAPVFQRQ